MKRKTKQRDAILNLLKKEDRPLSIEEILKGATEEIPDINLSTVYRNLKSLLDEKILSAVALPGNKTRYEVRSQDHRHYFLCDLCDSLFNVFVCPKGLLDMVPRGFSLRGHSITLNGFCDNCSPSLQISTR